jgi:hypothetical protein
MSIENMKSTLNQVESNLQKSIMHMHVLEMKRKDVNIDIKEERVKITSYEQQIYSLTEAIREGVNKSSAIV